MFKRCDASKIYTLCHISVSLSRGRHCQVRTLFYILVLSQPTRTRWFHDLQMLTLMRCETEKTKAETEVLTFANLILFSLCMAIALEGMCLESNIVNIPHAHGHDLLLKSSMENGLNYRSRRRIAGWGPEHLLAAW